MSVLPFIIKSCTNKNQRFNKSNLIIPILLFILISFIGLFKSADITVGFFGLKVMIEFTLLFFMAKDIFRKPDDIKKFITLLIMGALIMSLVGLIHFAFIPEVNKACYHGVCIPRIGTFYLGEMSGPGTARGSNEFAQYLLILIPFPILLLINKANKKKERLLYILIILLSISGIVLTLSRKVWLGLIFMVLFISLAKSKKIILGSIIILIVGSLLLPVFIVERMTSIFSIADQESINSNIHRINQWKETIETVSEESILFGLGTGMAGSTSLRSDSIKEILPHNMFLLIFAQLGLVGLLVFLTIYILMIKKAVSLYFSIKDSFNKAIVFSLLTSLLVILIIGMFGDVLEHTFLNMFFWLSGGLLCAIDSINKMDLEDIK